MRKFPYSDDPSRCPTCGSRKIKCSWLSIDENPPYYSMDFWCKRCGCEWSRYFRERYRLIRGETGPEDEYDEDVEDDEEGKNGT
jgi:hypothetical protein